MGAAFLAVSFINVRAIIDWEMIASIFYYTFFYGGILLLALGAILFVVKGLMGGEPISTFNSQTKEFTQRGKIIPFSEMSEIKMQASEVMGRKMVAILFRRNGKRKALVAGTLILNDTSDLEDLLEQLNELIK